ncbi:alpha-L-glutamate ligase [Streptomyces sp. SID13666]|uniref:ATP-grasp domain-containing protein n=1 Tax=unclassified Streptomyces TaxID=2593676 RepID=UPI0013C0CB82|nr:MULTISPECIES: alpha-L-glutamate ligase [unclassified Streptomyces]NEA55640.1 alpha-L-glutamate ligase [Streptomyces sp. SID13666]NEA73291.1 alpha-L-glutamate ligase [Streptomyces sp. SID13588]
MNTADSTGQRVCFLTDKPDHPLLAATATLLADRHHTHVEFTDPAHATEPAPAALADVYLLKSHTPQAIRLARALERRGARVVNSAASTELCQDRVRMAETALAAGLPFPVTRTVAPLSRLTAPPPSGYPFIVKSRANRRGDVVARVDDAAGLRDLARRWPDELVVVQDFTPGDGWDHKLWVIAGQVFTGLRPSPLGALDSADGPDSAHGADGAHGADSADSAAAEPGGQPPPPPPPPGAHDLALQAGKVFALDVYGVDVIADRSGTPLIVDINAFPGFRGGSGAPHALAALISSATMDICERDTEFPSA